MRMCLLPLLIGLVPALPAQADERFAELPEAVSRVERDTGGKVLHVRPIRRGDREIFRMKVLTPEGRVKIVLDDPKLKRSRREDGRSEPPRDERGAVEPERRSRGQRDDAND